MAQSNMMPNAMQPQNSIFRPQPQNGAQQLHAKIVSLTSQLPRLWGKKVVVLINVDGGLARQSTPSSAGLAVDL